MDLRNKWKPLIPLSNVQKRSFKTFFFSIICIFLCSTGLIAAFNVLETVIISTLHITLFNSDPDWHRLSLLSVILVYFTSVIHYLFSSCNNIVLFKFNLHDSEEMDRILLLSFHLLEELWFTEYVLLSLYIPQMGIIVLILTSRLSKEPRYLRVLFTVSS